MRAVIIWYDWWNNDVPNSNISKNQLSNLVIHSPSQLGLFQQIRYPACIKYDFTKQSYTVFNFTRNNIPNIHQFFRKGESRRDTGFDFATNQLYYTDR